MQQVAVIDNRSGGRDFDALVGPHLEGGYRVALAILQSRDKANRDAYLRPGLELG